MLLRENVFGWRLYKSRHCFTIRRPHPPLRSRLGQIVPGAMNVLFVVLLWLLGHDSTSLQPVLYAIPFSFLLGLYRFRPGMLYVNVRRRILGDVANGVPFSCLHVELSHDQEDRLYRVYLKGNGNSGEAAKDRGTWKRLVWESITETEATAVAEEFRVGGVGTPD